MSILPKRWWRGLALSLLVFVCNGEAHGDAPAATASRRSALVIETVYPGAAAQAVTDAVAAPIEQQLNGGAAFASIRSQCRDDGSYRCVVTLKQGVNLDAAKSLAQKRINSALDTLPAEVKRRGISVRAISPGVALVCVLHSPDGRFDTRYLGNYASIQIRDSLIRLPGLADAALIGNGENAVHILPDLAKLAAHDLTVTEFAATVEQQLKPAAKRDAAPPKGIPSDEQPPAQRLSVDDVGEIVVKAVNDQLIRVRDVARIEFGSADRPTAALFRGKQAVALVISPLPQTDAVKVGSAVKGELARLQQNLPVGVSLEIAADFAFDQARTQPPRSQYLLIDMRLPNGTSADRVDRQLERAGAALKSVTEIQDAVVLSENPFDRFRTEPCILVRMAGDSDADSIRRRIHKALGDEVKEAVATVCEVLISEGMATARHVADGGVMGADREHVRRLAGLLCERLRAKHANRDLVPSADDRPTSTWTIDDAKATAAGVAKTDALETVRLTSAPHEVGQIDQFGRTWPITVEFAAAAREPAGGNENLMVRSHLGKLVQLATIAELRQTATPRLVDRLELQPMVEFTANSVGGGSVDDLKRAAESTFESLRAELRLPDSYRLRWLGEEPAKK